MELTETKRQNAKCAWNAVAQAKQSFIKILDPDEIIAPHVQQAPTAPGAPLTDAEWKELMRNVSNLNRSCRPELDAVLAKRNTVQPTESLVDRCAKVAEQDSAMPDWKKGSVINERPIASVAQADWDDQHRGTQPAPVDGTLAEFSKEQK